MYQTLAWLSNNISFVSVKIIVPNISNEPSECYIDCVITIDFTQNTEGFKSILKYFDYSLIQKRRYGSFFHQLSNL